MLDWRIRQKRDIIRQMYVHVCIVQFPNALQSAVYGVQEILSIANRAIQMTNGRVEFIAQTIAIDANACLPTDDCDQRIIFVPPVFQDDNQINSIISQNLSVVAWLKQNSDRANFICGSCTAVALLAEAGVMRDRAATSTWWFLNDIAMRYPEIDLIRNDMLVQDAQIITSAGPYSYIAQTLHLIELLADAQAARLCAKIAVVEPGRPDNGMYSVPSIIAAYDPMLVRAQELVKEHLSNDFSVTKLASLLGYSERTLHRRLKSKTGWSPQRFISNVRMEVAKTLLETTDQPISSIGEAVGFINENSFRSAFSRSTGVSPTAYRMRMNPTAMR
jgi:transcriptional regulator GlxA family with amidase domain